MKSTHGFYNKYFQDYVESTVTTSSGKKKIERIYVGDYYRQDLSKMAYIAVRVMYIIAFACAVFLLAHVSVRTTISNFALIVVLPAAAAAVSLLFLAVALILYVAAHRDMTIGEYWETSIRIQKISKIAAICLLCAAISVVICFALQPVETRGGELRNAIEYSAAAALMLFIYAAEKRIPYTTRPSNNRPPDDGLRI